MIHKSLSYNIVGGPSITAVQSCPFTWPVECKMLFSKHFFQQLVWVPYLYLLIHQNFSIEIAIKIGFLYSYFFFDGQLLRRLTCSSV